MLIIAQDNSKLGKYFWDIQRDDDTPLYFYFFLVFSETILGSCVGVSLDRGKLVALIKMNAIALVPRQEWWSQDRFHLDKIAVLGADFLKKKMRKETTCWLSLIFLGCCIDVDLWLPELGERGGIALTPFAGSELSETFMLIVRNSKLKKVNIIIIISGRTWIKRETFSL